MNALWWWIDRWRKSTAFTEMTLAQQGAYRNLLDEATLRGGALPDDERTLSKASGDMRAWPKLRDVVMARFELREDGWHNETLDSVLRQSERRRKNQANYRARIGNSGDNGRDNVTGHGHYNEPDNEPAYPISGSVNNTPPNPPASQGGRSLKRKISSKEREKAEMMFRAGWRCNHDPRCDSNNTCIGRLVQGWRREEAEGQSLEVSR
jgi:uncharacterized protein YdaU (DUF1376 family)